MDAKVKRRCQVDDCDGKHSALGYCDFHYIQFKRYGKVIQAKPDRPLHGKYGRQMKERHGVR